MGKRGYKHKFFGSGGPCGGCWCCKARLPSPPPPPQQSRVSLPWKCDWGAGSKCRAGYEETKRGYKHKFFGSGGPCGGCWCCKARLRGTEAIDTDVSLESM